MTYEPTNAPNAPLQGPVDPDRPWITNPEDDLSKMSWLKTMFSPFGQTPKLHFTRAWTFMFMARLLVVVVPTFIGALIGLAGANGQPVMAMAGIGAAIVFPITIITSLFAHMKRLSHAGKTPAWAGLVLAPLIMAAAAFVLVATQTVPEANKIAEDIAFAKENPEAAKEKAKAEREALQAGAESGEAKPKQSGQRRRGGPGGKQEFNASEYVVSKAMPMAMMAWAFSALLVMLWSLLWVCRLPGAGEKKAKPSYET